MKAFTVVTILAVIWSGKTLRGERAQRSRITLAPVANRHPQTSDLQVRMRVIPLDIAFIVSSGSVLKHSLPEESDSSDIFDCLVDVSCWDGVGEGSVRVGAGICRGR